MPTSVIKDLLKKWEDARAMVLEWHPNQAAVSRHEFFKNVGTFVPSYENDLNKFLTVYDNTEADTDEVEEVQAINR
ncbi:hypothetical protein TNCV_2492311 [Trichonephila clavipes]|nr:hypothetical protein TNCV_2492311 [Trichonephila clavipes]